MHFQAPCLTDYSDFTDLGPLMYKDIRYGEGDTPVDGDRVLVDWDG